MDFNAFPKKVTMLYLQELAWKKGGKPSLSICLHGEEEMGCQIWVSFVMTPNAASYTLSVLRV